MTKGNRNNTETRRTLKKAERLHHKKGIDELFEKGSSFSLHSFHVFYIKKKSDSGFPAAVILGVSKKNYPRAHDRNRIKRLSREAFRLTKAEFYEELENKKINLLLAFHYRSKTILSLEQLKTNISEIFKKLVELNEAGR